MKNFLMELMPPFVILHKKAPEHTECALCGNSHIKNITQVYNAIADYLRPKPVKLVFPPEFEYSLRDAVSGYAYKPFPIKIRVNYNSEPPYVYISFYTKAAITEEVKEEVVWAIEAMFREYMELWHPV